MTTKVEPTPVDPLALRFHREQLRISQRELGRRVAERLGKGEGERAIQVRLSRIERGDEVTLEDRELLDALAAELAVGVGDLGEPPVWVWITLQGGRPGIVELAERFPAYSSPELAYQARDWLAHASNGHFTPFQDAQLVPMRVSTLRDEVVDENFPGVTDDERKLLVAVDPGEEVLPYLAALNEVLNADDPENWSYAAIVETIERFNLLDETQALHRLALRRLTRLPENEPGLAAAWRRREERLFMILEVHHLRMLEEREKILADIHP